MSRDWVRHLVGAGCPIISLRSSTPFCADQPSGEGVAGSGSGFPARLRRAAVHENQAHFRKLWPTTRMDRERLR